MSIKEKLGVAKSSYRVIFLTGAPLNFLSTNPFTISGTQRNSKPVYMGSCTQKIQGAPVKKITLQCPCQFNNMIQSHSLCCLFHICGKKLQTSGNTLKKKLDFISSNLTKLGPWILIKGLIPHFYPDWPCKKYESLKNTVKGTS